MVVFSLIILCGGFADSNEKPKKRKKKKKKRIIANHSKILILNYRNTNLQATNTDIKWFLFFHFYLYFTKNFSSCSVRNYMQVGTDFLFGIGFVWD